METDRRTFIESCFGAAAATTGSSARASALEVALAVPQAASASALTPIQAGTSGVLSQSIAGQWRLRLDPDDAGLAGKWFQGSQGFHGQISLPGSTSQSNFGEQNERREREHLTRTYLYTGPAWYQRDVAIPESWRGKRLALFLERCHWESRAWLDDYALGLQNSLSTPHAYDIGIVDKLSGERNEKRISPGSHRLTLRIDNRTKVDLGRSTAISAQTGAGWNGVIGRMEIEATDLVWIEQIVVNEHDDGMAVRLQIHLRNLTGTSYSANLRCAIRSADDAEKGALPSAQVQISAMPTSVVEHELRLPAGADRWSEFSPSLFHLRAELEASGPRDRFFSVAQTSFGLRSLSTAGLQLKLNGRRVMLRGTVDNGIFPQQGHPPTDLPFWRQRLVTYRDYGFNHVRFHSWCPPDAAFTAADELGMLFQVENPLWIADGRVSADDRRRQYIRDEAVRIVNAYGNHPSFGLISMGNEEGSGQDPFLGNLVRELQALDGRHLYTSTTEPDNIHRPDNYFVTAGPSWQNLRGDPRLENQAPNTNVDYEPYIVAAHIDRPVLAHELGQWTVYPNLGEEKQYTGPLRPRYLDLYRDALRRGHLLDQSEPFRRSSGALMILLYKEEIEAVLRTKDASGFQLLGLTDFPGFGPAFIGVLDTLGESKGLIKPEAYRRFCSPTVPLLLLEKRIWTSGETLNGILKIAHYGAENLKSVSPSWKVRDASGRTVAAGSLPARDIATGGLSTLGTINVNLSRFPAPAMVSIECRVGAAANDWDVWIYPRGGSFNGVARTGRIAVAKTWRDALPLLKKGRTVVLLLGAQEQAKTVPTSFTTIFWSASWFPKRHEKMGILCDPSHPAFRRFPTASHADWQWWELMSKSRAFDLSTAPEGFQPLVHVIDDAAKARRLGGVFEARVGTGRLLACSFALDRDLQARPAAGAFRASLLSYAASADFHPENELTIGFLDSLLGANQGNASRGNASQGQDA